MYNKKGWTTLPLYSFICDKDNNGCGNTFEVTATMTDAPALYPTCPTCGANQPVRRNYQAEQTTVINATPKTLGMLADRNTSKMSSDEKNAIYMENNEYKHKPFKGKLPDGASTYPRDHEGRIIPSKRQRNKDPRRKS